jgi:hypothetical protein
MRILMVLAVAVLLAGCGRLTDLKYQPVALYGDDDVKDLSRKLAGISNARDFAYEVMQITNHRCDLFFESLDRVRADADFALARVAALSTGLPTLLTSVHVAEKAVANVSAALGFVTGTINDAKQYYLLADFKPEIYKRWQVYRAEQQLRVEGYVHDRMSPAEVRLRVYEYVRLCLPSQLKQWLHEAAGSLEVRPLGVNAWAPRVSSSGRKSAISGGGGLPPGPLVHP